MPAQLQDLWRRGRCLRKCTSLLPSFKWSQYQIILFWSTEADALNKEPISCDSRSAAYNGSWTSIVRSDTRRLKSNALTDWATRVGQYIHLYNYKPDLLIRRHIWGISKSFPIVDSPLRGSGRCIYRYYFTYGAGEYLAIKRCVINRNEHWQPSRIGSARIRTRATRVWSKRLIHSATAASPSVAEWIRRFDQISVN